jgi:hypothetical protein
MKINVFYLTVLSLYKVDLTINATGLLYKQIRLPKTLTQSLTPSLTGIYLTFPSVTMLTK